MPNPPEGKFSPIVPPGAPPGDRVRVVANAIAQLITGGGFVMSFVDDLVPTGAEKERRKWESEISQRTNEHSAKLERHESILQPVQRLEGVDAELAVVLAVICPDGLGRTNYDLKELCQLLPEKSSKEVEEAAYELKALNIVHIVPFIGGYWHLRITTSFYPRIDHRVMGWSTTDDAVEIAKMLLDGADERVANLHSATDWSRRRFNPALRMLIEEAPLGLISNEIQPDYVTAYVILRAEDKVSLKRFIRDRPKTSQ